MLWCQDGRYRAMSLLWMVVVVMNLQGCASIVSGSSQVVSVDTPGCAGARCELSNDKGKFFVASTPGTVTLTRSYNNLQVVCNRNDWSSDPLSVASTTKGLAFGNILVGGVIGAGVDISTGAAYDYPQLITVPMQCESGQRSPPPEKPASHSTRLGLQVALVEAVPGTAVSEGVHIVYVEPQSLAEQTDLKTGDVILWVDGNEITNPDALAALVATAGADPDHAREMELLLCRNGEDIVRWLVLPAISAR